eukprot:6195636-Pleurochrysis_carterae.AAC.1
MDTRDIFLDPIGCIRREESMFYVVPVATDDNDHICGSAPYYDVALQNIPYPGYIYNGVSPLSARIDNDVQAEPSRCHFPSEEGDNMSLYSQDERTFCETMLMATPSHNGSSHSVDITTKLVLQGNEGPLQKYANIRCKVFSYAQQSTEVPVIARHTDKAIVKCPEPVPARAASSHKE